MTFHPSSSATDKQLSISESFLKDFLQISRFEKFCSDLTTGGLDELCESVSEDVSPELKVEYSDRGPTISELEANTNITREDVRDLQEHGGLGKGCRCPVSSASTMDWLDIVNICMQRQDK